ncbi:unnamed protein product [Callosobruchus maculatus]|uniref:THAP-type domain-containing protein n=1 Tax=Callosobruchus maculatus TaxID=64391 RepID=A0A653DX24_CALMS|nr:unnamed protein product [Callosobruchus maculatus]
MKLVTAENLSEASDATLTASEASSCSPMKAAEQKFSSDTLTASEIGELDESALPVHKFIGPAEKPVEAEHATIASRKRRVPQNEQSIVSASWSGSESSISNSPRSVKRRKIQHMRYFGDFQRKDIECPIKRQKFWVLANKTVKLQKKTIKFLQQKNRHLLRKINSLQALNLHLRRKDLISESAEHTLNNSLTESAQALFNRILQRRTTKKFPPALRKFALTLNFYSRKAYNYVRSTFNNVLPHVKTISKWYATIESSPGFMKEAFNALKNIASQQNYKICCNLVFDEMSIRHKVEWDGYKTYGYIDLGLDVESENLEEAKEALVFMVVALNGTWKIPVAYFLINKLCASEKANLLLNCLEFVHETGVEIVSVTFDGAPTNLSMCRVLGADFKDTENLKTYFLHPVTENKVFIFLDMCHMFKLIRNCLGSSKIMENNSGIIDWQYMEKLCDLQEREGLHAATKLKRRHLLWMKEKMRVSLAVQTLSKSVADALDFLNKDIRHKDFANSEATAEFCRIMNNTFDIFNSRNVLTKKPFEKPLSAKNHTLYYQYLDECVKYIKQLKIFGKPVLESPKRTGFLGFIISITSLKMLYDERVLEKQHLKYILTYKLSQDHLEIFFSCVRSKGGYNNNPTSKQFQSIIKRLLVHSEVRGSENANAIALDGTSILHCSSAPLKKYNTEDVNQKLQTEVNPQEEILFLNSMFCNLTSYSDDIIAYIAGFVVKQVKRLVECVYCLDILESDRSPSALQVRKCYGILSNASSYVVTLCKCAEKVIRAYAQINAGLKGNFNNMLQNIIKMSMEQLPRNLLECFQDHIYDDDPLSNHSVQLTKIILKTYVTLRLKYEVSKLDHAKERIRSVYTKTVLFKNQ